MKVNRIFFLLFGICLTSLLSPQFIKDWLKNCVELKMIHKDSHLTVIATATASGEITLN